MGIIKCVNTECRDFSRAEVNNCSRPLTRILKCPEAVIPGQKKENTNPQITQIDADSTGKNKDWAWYVRELRSNECACGAMKKPGYSFCWGCYSSLPYELSGALYKHMGEGYEEAYEEAHRYLEENKR